MPDARSRASKFSKALLIPTLLLALAASVAWLAAGGAPGGVTGPHASATQEARDFATAQAVRAETQVVAAASLTAGAQATATTERRERDTAATETTIAVAREAAATEEAIPTQTALALAFEMRRAEAEVTVQRLTLRATHVAGPISGTLDYNGGGQVACASSGASVRDFIAESRFRNPAVGVRGYWDYGIVFTNLGDETEYRLILDSDGRWSLNLHSPHFDIENRDTSPQVDTTPAAWNTLKAYVTGDEALFYVNGEFVETLDLVMFGLAGAPGAPHEVKVCAGLRKEEGQGARAIPFESFSVWSLP